jgi:hypothetical protein
MITVTPNTEKIYFKGTTVELASVVSRLEFSAPKDGKTIQVAPNYYTDNAAYESGDDTISIEGVEGFLLRAKYYDLAKGTDPETYDPQTIQIAHDKVKADLESLGYNVVISGI